MRLNTFITIRISGHSCCDNNDNNNITYLKKFGESMQFNWMRISKVPVVKISRKAEDKCESNTMENMS